jgi:regulatory protein
VRPRRKAGRDSGPRGTAKDRALRLLGVRWRSRDELRRRLVGAGFDPDEVDVALEDLERVGLVDDERFAREVARHHARGRLSGNRAIRSALRQKGVDGQAVEEALREAGSEEDRAKELATARIRRMTAIGPEAASRRLYGLLLRRGFSPGVAHEACRIALRDAFGSDPIAESSP